MSPIPFNSVTHAYGNFPGLPISHIVRRADHVALCGPQLPARVPLIIGVPDRVCGKCLQILVVRARVSA
jgi:hypothetical protein